MLRPTAEVFWLTSVVARRISCRTSVLISRVRSAKSSPREGSSLRWYINLSSSVAHGSRGLPQVGAAVGHTGRSVAGGAERARSASRRRAHGAELTRAARAIEAPRLLGRA